MPRGYDDGRRAARAVTPDARSARPPARRALRSRVELVAHDVISACATPPGTGWWGDVEMMGAGVESMGTSYSGQC